MRKVGILLALIALSTAARGGGLPEARPADLGFDPSGLDRIDAAVTREIAAKRIPGAVVVVGRHGRIALARSYGLRAVEPAPEAMTRDTIFDLASLTKPIATATSLMILVERGRLGLDDRLGKLLPEFDNHGKGEITVEQLLRHRSGLIADNPISDYSDGPDNAWKRLADLGMVAKPGERFLYSDVNYIILGKIVETIGKRPLNDFADREVFRPLQMNETLFAGAPYGNRIGPGPSHLTYRNYGPQTGPTLHEIPESRFAPTEPQGKTMRRGRVHDPRAAALGEIAGHAGLFGTADDLAVFARMLLDGGRTRFGSSILKPETVRIMTSPGDTPPKQRRGLGWDIDTPYGAPRGRVFGPTSFGHTGFTGTSLWIDPETQTFVILLTSRLHPDGKGPSPTALRYEIATIVGEAIEDLPVRPVDCGVDVLIRDKFAPLKGKRVGLITNQTGRARDGRSTIDALFKAPDVKLVALFSPEHGIRGIVDKEVADDKDEATGLPIFSLYGKTRKPAADSLKGIDVLVYDIQDIGARFYTYISTLGLALEAAGEAKLPVVVLDRPNPIGGVAVGGPVRDPEFASFIAHDAMPVRHGMTVGEIARMFVGERKLPVDLRVIECMGWRRPDLYDGTGLTWVNPSPNMRSPTEAMLYPGVGLLEATNLATGRGTDTPFEKVGAPWIDAVEWSRALNGLDLHGVRFVPIHFTPKERQFAGKECGGVQIQITDWSVFDPIDLGLGMAVTLRCLYSRAWETEGFLKMLADRKTYEAMVRGAGVKELKALYAEESRTFEEIRARYLIYPPPSRKPK